MTRNDNADMMRAFPFSPLHPRIIIIKKRGGGGELGWG
jgi:hypothetical protein